MPFRIAGFVVVALASSLILSARENGHDRMIELLRALGERALEEHAYLEDRTARSLRAELQRLGPATPAAVELELRYRLGEAELKLGNVDDAISQLERAYRVMESAGSDVDPGWRSRLAFRLGVSYLALYQLRSCREPGSTANCTWPVRGSAGSPDAAGTAIRYLSEPLSLSSAPSPAQFAARWLLNIAHMMAGGYPDGVPKRWLLPESHVSSDDAFPRFQDVALRAGVDLLSLSGGVVADDFDTDGDVDLLVSVYPLTEQLRWFRNEGGLRFEDHTTAAGLAGITGGLNMVQGDYDNDGDVDVFLLRGAWAEDKGRHPNSLIRNNGDGTFTDVTFDAGLGNVHYPTQTASWADFDNDGDLDLYVGNETTPRQTSPAELFRNEGNGTFVDVAREAGVTNLRFTKAVLWGDYDADRFPDIYVSNLRASNRLYHNNGDGSFTDVAEALSVAGPEASFPAWFWDFDNDGHLDIFVSAYTATIAHLTASAVGMRLPMEFPGLYRNDGRGGFDNVAASAGLARPSAPMGANFGDLDGDGFVDFYLGTGYPNFAELMPNVMYKNREGREFLDVTSAGGFGHLQKGHGIAFADLDHDGDNDVFEQMGGGLRGDLARNVLFENPGFGNHWIRVRLIGRQSNRSALGAKIRVVVPGRSIVRHVSSGGSFGANPLSETIGLGQSERIDRLEVYWPSSDRTETFRSVPVDREILIVEGWGESIYFDS